MRSAIAAQPSKSQAASKRNFSLEGMAVKALTMGTKVLVGIDTGSGPKGIFSE
jgi:hypothetical protein